MHWIHLAPRPSLCAPPLPARHHARRCRPVCAPSPPPSLVGALARIGAGGGGRGDGDTGRVPSSTARPNTEPTITIAIRPPSAPPPAMSWQGTRKPESTIDRKSDG